MRTMKCHSLTCSDCGGGLIKAVPEHQEPFYFCATCQTEFYERQTEPDHIELIRTPYNEGHTCGKCGKLKEDIEDRYSFGVYAGRFCIPCCGSYRDNCGVDRPQGDPADLDEPYGDEDDVKDHLDDDPNYARGNVRYGHGEY